MPNTFVGSEQRLEALDQMRSPHRSRANPPSARQPAQAGRTSPARVADAGPALARDLEANLAGNSYLLKRILFEHECGENVNEAFNMWPFCDQVTVPALRDLAVE